MANKEVDTRGRSCPEPVIMTKQAIQEIPEGEITVLVGEEVAKENVSRMARNSGCSVEVEDSEENGYRLLITKRWLKISDSFCVITFYSTHLALEFERVVEKEEIKAKSIPVPRQISSSCGIAGRFAEEKLEDIKDICQEYDIEFEQIYRVYQDKSKEPEELV
mgnify:CR=1 FL=1